MSNLAIIARVQLSAESASKYVEAAKALIDVTRAEAGCIKYGMGVDICDPTVVWIAEEWASQDALNDHLRADHIQAFLAQVAELEVLSLDATQYEVSSQGPVQMPE